MKKILFILSIVTLSFMVSPVNGQTKQAIKKGKNIVTKVLGKKAVKESELTAAKRMAAVGGKRYGEHYAERAVGEQVIKKIQREKLLKQFEKEGVTSFWDWGRTRTINATKKLISKIKTRDIRHTSYLAAMKNGSKTMPSAKKTTQNAGILKNVAKKLKIQNIKFSDFISKNLTEEERLKIIMKGPFPTASRGKWSGMRGNSDFYPNLDDIVNPKTYGEEMSWRKIYKKWGLKETDPIPYRNGQPDFAAMNLEYGKVVWKGEKGIGENLTKWNGKNFNKVDLDIAANKMLAKQRGLNYEDDINNKIISVFRGSSEHVEELAKFFKCSPDEVWVKCGNPTKRILVWHEYIDGRTMALVPWDIHAPLHHVGGMNMYKSAYLKSRGH